MKRIRLCGLAGLLVLLGCVASPYVVKDYELGRPASANVGSVIMAWEYGSPVDGRIVGMRKELYYSGIAQEVVYVNYREYAVSGYGSGSCLTGSSQPTMTEALARQPYYQELRYDLSKSKIITFQEVRIQVIDADAERIRFTVINGLGNWGSPAGAPADDGEDRRACHKQGGVRPAMAHIGQKGTWS